MLITFLALLALLNAMMGWTHLHISWFPYSLQQVFGWVFAPIAWLIGIPWHDAPTIGNLLGTRMVLNEFVAFAQLGTLKDSLDPRSFRSEEHTSELQSRQYLVCRLLLEKKKKCRAH